MTVCIDARGATLYRGTGIGTYTYQLVNNIRTFDLISNYTLLDTPDSFLQQLAFTDNFKCLTMPVFKPEEYLADYAKLFSVLSENPPDILHLPQNGLGFPNLKNTSVVVTIHDLIPYTFPQTSSQRYRTRFLNEMPGIVEKAERIITVSYHSRKDLIEILDVPPEKIVMIYEAPEPIYRPIEKVLAKKIIEEKYGISSRYILYTGGLSYRKNLLNLFTAYKEAKKDLPDIPKLVIAGQKAGNYRKLLAMLDKLALTADVVFPGFIPLDDMPYLYSGAELFVYPSLYEGFGLPPLEAMACGVPVITSNTTSLPEVVGNAGIMVDPYDYTSLAASIYNVLTNQTLAANLRKAGLKRVAKFSWQKTAYDTFILYQSILDERKI